MKFRSMVAATISVVLGFLAAASAYDVRAAYERAFFYSIYAMEDVVGLQELGIGDGRFMIASGCRGTREREQAILGVTGRCTFGELMDHIWRQKATVFYAPDDTQTILGYDTKPKEGGWTPLASTVEDADKMAGLVTQQNNLHLKSIRPFREVQAPDGTIHRIDEKGHLGNVDERKLFPSYSEWPEENGVRNFAKCLELFAARAREINRIWAKARREVLIIGDDQQKNPLYRKHTKADQRYTRFLKSAYLAIRKVHDMRLKSSWDARTKLGRWNELAQGFEPVYDLKKSSVGETSWNEWDKAKSIKRLQDMTKTDYNTAETRWNSHIQSISQGGIYHGHQAAITAAEKAVKVMKDVVDGKDC